MCFAGVLCSYTHKWVVPSTEIKYTRATVTQSHFKKSVLLSKLGLYQGFAISWSVCKWVTKDCFSCVYSTICSRWLLWSYWAAPSVPWVHSCSPLGPWSFARVSGDPGGDSLSCCRCLHNVILTGQGVHTRRLFKQKRASRKSTQAAPSTSLSLWGERFPL